MAKKWLSLSALAFVSVFALASCGGTNSGDSATAVPNKDKPVVFFNRQPSNPTTGVLDMDTLSFNDKTYYVGFDSTQGGEVQGQMIVDYITSHVDTIDRNNDGTIGYVLAIGDQGHNDSIARTIGIRTALGTLKDNSSAANVSQEGSITVGEKTFKIKELAAQEMKSGTSTWDAPTAGNAIGGWKTQYSNQIDMIVSNNDGMGMSMYNTAVDTNFKVPVFGYDSNADALAAMDPTGQLATSKGIAYAGTVNQHSDVQAYITLRVIRNLLDGHIDDATTYGISVADTEGNKLNSTATYVADERSIYALNEAVTSANLANFTDATAIDSGIKTALSSSTTYRVWIDIYNSSDNFLSTNYFPILRKYVPYLKLSLNEVSGDGSSEASVSDKLTNLTNYDAFAINMVKTSSGSIYTSLLNS